jgi:hypothetical protein
VYVIDSGECWYNADNNLVFNEELWDRRITFCQGNVGLYSIPTGVEIEGNV